MTVTVSVKNSVVIVTGSGQGIGRAYAETLAANGAKVVVAEINASKAEDVAKSIREAGGDAVAVQTDVTKLESALNMARVAVEKYGRIDVLINNAAIFYKLAGGSLLSLSETDWDRVMNVNVKGVWLCCKAVLPHMIKQGTGKIINVSSNTALVGSPFYLHYVASKGAVISMTKSLCKEVGILAPKGRITVNAIAPGATFSEAGLELPAEMVNIYLSTQSIKHKITPEDMSAPMLFLCSNASDYMSGHLLVCDAGVSLY